MTALELITIAVPVVYLGVFVVVAWNAARRSSRASVNAALFFGALAFALVDNAMAESFFATLECELIDRERFATRDEARTKIFDYLETWYNPRRRHSALDYASPMEYEGRCQEAISALSV